MIPRIYRLSQGPLQYALEWESRFYDLSAAGEVSSGATSLASYLQWAAMDSDAWAAGVAKGRWPSLDSWSPESAILGTPLPASEVGKVLALGKNFRAHAAEFGEEVPAEPLFFNKLPETLTAHGSTVTVPAWYQARVDHEAELVVVVARGGKEIPVERAMEHVAGYSVANDLTARTLQKDDRGKKFPWFRGKNMDGFLPMGPCFVPRDALQVDHLRVSATVNGESRQDANTADMVVDIPHALAYLSRHLSLYPGDLVLMGTPEGVGPLYDGDEVICSVEGIGSLRTRIARP